MECNFKCVYARENEKNRLLICVVNGANCPRPNCMYWGECDKCAVQCERRKQ